MELNMKEPANIRDLKEKLKKISKDMPKNFDVVVESNLLTIDGKWMLKRQQNSEQLLETIQRIIEEEEMNGLSSSFRNEERKTIKDYSGNIDVNTKAFLYAHLENEEQTIPKIILSYIDVLETAKKDDIDQWRKNGFELHNLDEVDRKQLAPTTNYTYGVMLQNRDRIDTLLKKYKLNRKHFEKYFFYGIDNRGPILEGIVHRVCRDLNNKYTRYLEERKKLPSKEEKLEALRNRVVDIYRQLYTFLNVVEEDDKRFDCHLTNTEETRVRNAVDTKINKMLKDNMLLIYPRGIFVKDKPDDDSKKRNLEVYNSREHIWTDEMYEVLKQLEIMEELWNQEYYRNWLEAKFSRLKTKGYEEGKLDELKKPFKKYLEKRKEEEKTQS